ncbi:hypothetical protein SUGI_1038290 [Cryptomeria japonica]|uniref:protein LONGIFOLIA 2 n=1 Tax=Cryptomeria japonica TaxID=3369 RepID=UPI0024149BEF|nr:protein LONGIFOLIA 2 [Cryptomeria japonica]XP_057868777.2 protein LONGIFOLIA 2 [Cryptomeria japonica]XP_057868778.2 protein LONGIFOLIA 2 [Cryptomeria japonica]GLJ49199.1 hypothetical protein SUGI_1038290 [Cryptomeria japonica]
MSTKFLHAISDDPNLEKQLEKQIGCMTGIFQMFDRHQILAVKRLYGHKKLPAARQSFSCESPRPDDKTHSVQYAGGDESHRSPVDSLGHSNAEPSSRGTSRASSVDYSNSSRFSACIPESMPSEKLEAARSSWDDRVTKSLNTKDSRRLPVVNRGNASILSKEPPSPSLDSRQPGRLSLDIRDVVRDSFYRDCPRLSVEIKADDRSQSREGHKYVLKPKDSPRPPMDVKDASKQQQSSLSFSPKVGKSPKSRSQVPSDGKSRTSADKASEDITKKSRSLADLNESLRVLAKLREAPWNFVESKEAPRPSFESKEGPRFSFSKDSPRFSCDGKEIPRSSSLKLREPPRLSLDSRESSRNFVDLKRNSSVNDTPNATQRHGHTSGDFIELDQCSGRKRSPSVVARLMGLEEMPTGSSTPSQKRELSNQCSSEEKSVPRTSAEVRNSLEYLKIESFKQSREKENSLIELSKSHNFKPQFSTDRSNLVEATADRKLTSTRHIQSSDSPRFKHHERVPKPILTQRCNVETAPWRQPDSYQTHPRKAVEAQNFLPELARKNDGSSQYLYSEIEKRLKLLELENCDKDLRTLKQILEAMQHKGLLDSTKERLNRHQNDGSYTPRSRVFQEAKPASRTSEMEVYHMKSGSSNSATAFEAPIVIMKPTKLVNKSSNSARCPIEGLPGSPRKVGSITQSKNADSKRSTMGGNRVKDPQSGKSNHRESAYCYNNELTSPRQNKREHNCRTKSEEQSGQVSQRGRPSSPSPTLSPPTRSQQISREIINNAKNNHPSFSSPKAQRRKTEIERKPRQSVSLKSPKQGTKQFGSETENQSPRNRIRTKGTSVLQLEEVSECSRDTAGDQYPDTPRADEISVRSESNISSISQMDYEVTSSERSYTSKISNVKEEYDCKFDNENYYAVQSTGSTNAKLKKTSHFRTDYKASSAMTRHEISKNSPKLKDEELPSKMEELHLNQCEEMLISSTAPEASEQPSPVSVLDASLFYQDDLSPSPVKKCLIPFKEGETREAGNQDHWIDFNYYSPDPIPVSPMAINSKLLKNVQSLVRKLEDLASTEDTTMDLQMKSIANQHKAPEYKYMLEILSASGLLQKDPDSLPMEFHASGFPINPELFHVLEQKRNTKKSDDHEKLDRKLLFGTVNDILQRKLYPYLQFQQPWIIKQHNSLLACTRPSGEHLVKLVWDELQGFLSSFPPVDSYETIFSIMQKDLAENAERWCDYRSDIGEVVLDVERMIFKDLIDETMGILGYRVSRHPSSSSPITTDQTTRSRRQLLF